MSESSVSSEEKFVEKWLSSHEAFAAAFVERWLQSHPHQARVYLEKRCTRNVSRHLGVGGALEEGKLLKHFSTPNLHLNRRKKPTSELRQMNRQELFMELLRDVVSPDFDANHMSHKILVNVLVLTNADRSSLFLVEGPEDNPLLVSRLFDVMEHSSVEEALHDEVEAIKIPVGVGIIGHAAKTGETINLHNAYEDPRFNADVDKYTGYQTRSILCVPIKAPDGQVIGVAQVINKNGGQGVFTENDEEEFRTYLTFCAIGLINAQLFDNSFALSRRLQILLQLCRGLFEDTTSLEGMVRKIMLESQELIPCERSTVLLLHQDHSEDVTFKHAFQMEHAKLLQGSQTSICRSLEASAVSDLDLAKHVATTAEPANVNNSGTGTHFPSTSQLGRDTKDTLCMPIFNKNGKTIGVAKLTNKLNGLPFNETDQESFEVFATFCGLGIHNVLNYEKIVKANAKQSVALEVLSYHASCSVEEAERLMQLDIPESSVHGLQSFQFDDLFLSEDETVLTSVRMFLDCGLLNKLNIDTKVLYRWVLTVKKNYRPVTYHNWRHAFNVAQTMFAAFTSGALSERLNDMEKLALIIGCFCHDLDHRGTNNAFQIKTDSPLALLYSTSTMEHHHFDHCIMILNSQGNEILNGLTTEQYSVVMQMLESAILSTDLALYFRKKGQFHEVVQAKKFDWANITHRDLLRGMLMTACDVAAITKPWEIQKRVAELVAGEFFEQGDRERTDLHMEPIAMMDRQKQNELPKMQVGFINAICLPLYEMLADLHDGLTPLLSGCTNNRNSWQSLADNPLCERVCRSGSQSPTLESTTCTTLLPGGGQQETAGPSTPRPIEAWSSDSQLVEGEGPSHPAHQEYAQILAKRKKLKCALC